MKVFTQDEATHVERNERGVLQWGVAGDMTGNCGGVLGQLFGGDEAFFVRDHATGWPIELAIAVNYMEALYAAGYAVVKLDGEEDAVGNLTRAELLAKLTESEAHYEALRSNVRSLANQMGGSGLKFELLELTQPPESRP